MTYYRIIDEGDELTVITDDGGVACIRDCEGDTYNTVIDLYQSRLTQEMIDDGTVWDEVGNGKMYCEESNLPYTDQEHINTALNWLVVGEDVFEVDEAIWEGF